MNRKNLTSKISNELNEYDKQSTEKYKKISQLGVKGKEGTTFLVKNKRGKQFAMKTFSSKKSINNLEKEITHLKKAYKSGISPKL